AGAAAGLAGLRALTGRALLTAAEGEPELGALLAAELPAGLDPGDPFHVELAETGLAYLDHGGRIEPTAAALHVHGNTVKYRIRRLQELTGRPLLDPSPGGPRTGGGRCAAGSRGPVRDLLGREDLPGAAGAGRRRGPAGVICPAGTTGPEGRPGAGPREGGTGDRTEDRRRHVADAVVAGGRRAVAARRGARVPARVGVRPHRVARLDALVRRVHDAERGRRRHLADPARDAGHLAELPASGPGGARRQDDRPRERRAADARDRGGRHAPRLRRRRPRRSRVDAGGARLPLRRVGRAARPAAARARHHLRGDVLLGPPGRPGTPLPEIGRASW